MVFFAIKNFAKSPGIQGVAGTEGGARPNIVQWVWEGGSVSHLDPSNHLENPTPAAPLLRFLHSRSNKSQISSLTFSRQPYQPIPPLPANPTLKNPQFWATLCDPIFLIGRGTCPCANHSGSAPVSDMWNSQIELTFKPTTHSNLKIKFLQFDLYFHPTSFNIIPESVPSFTSFESLDEGFLQ